MLLVDAILIGEPMISIGPHLAILPVSVKGIPLKLLLSLVSLLVS
jgi:hypothetical protein